MKLVTKLLISTFVLLLGSFLTGAAFADDQHGCLRLKEQKFDYTALARGTMVEVDFKFNTHNCHLPMDSGSPTTALTTELPSGLESVTGRTVYDKFKKSETSPSRTMAGEMNVPVFITMPGDLAPGTYNIPAKLSYQAINKKGDLVEESMALVIPLKVVSSKADVHAMKKSDPWRPLKMTGLIAAVIVVMPVFITLGIFQLVTGIEVLPAC